MSGLFGKFGLGIAKETLAKLAAVAVVAAVGGVVTYCSLKDDKQTERSEEHGATRERERQNQEVLNEVGKAHDAVSQPKPDATQRMRCKYDRSASCPQ